MLSYGTMMTSQNTEFSYGRGERVVRAVLPPTAVVRERNAGRDADLIVNGQAISVKWIGQGNLADVRAALEMQPEQNVVLVARQMSPGARAMLSEAGVNWADETGAAEIAVGTIVVSRSGTPVKKTNGIRHWTPAVIAVAEALLCGAKGTQTAVQDATGLSAGSCANALRFLTEDALLTSAAKRGPASARQVSDRRRLLDAYAAAVNEQPTGIRLQIGVTWQDVIEGVAELGHRFHAHQVDWALTGGAAAAVIAPLISSVSQAAIYLEARSMAELHALAENMGLRPIEGGRLTLKPFPSSTVNKLATREGRDLRVAPWPRIYADLLNEGVRGEEAAVHLYEVIHE